MGWQEGLVGSPLRAETSSDLEAGRSGTDANSAASAGSSQAQRPAQNVDPWGLEQAATHMPELGCGFGSDVAKLRHVKLSRQAAIQWQTFDAFSRISMSLGVQSLLQAMSYYILGYLLVEVGCKTAAVFGVIVFTMVAS